MRFKPRKVSFELTLDYRKYGLLLQYSITPDREVTLVNVWSDRRNTWVEPSDNLFEALDSWRFEEVTMKAGLEALSEYYAGWGDAEYHASVERNHPDY